MNSTDATRKGDWITTFLGVHFYPLDPRPDEIQIEDIAHALSNQCRFSGHVLSFYSVAEHSVRVARALPREMALYGLLHDASEAYLVDIPRPLKRLPEFARYLEAEGVLMRAILDRFGLGPLPALVYIADDALLATEGRDLMPKGFPWASIAALPLEEKINITWTPEQAQHEFLYEFERLTRGGAA
jgi:hypothetical protein